MIVFKGGLGTDNIVRLASNRLTTIKYREIKGSL